MAQTFSFKVPAILPVSLAGILVTYRATVLLLTLLWIMVNLPLLPKAVFSVMCKRKQDLKIKCLSRRSLKGCTGLP
eukprot:s7047_g1.t1